MAVQRTATGGPRWQPKTAIALVVLVVIALLSSISAAWTWTTTGDDLSAAEQEREGIALLRPLTDLIAELAEAQSAAVRGGSVQTAAVETAIEQVAAADRSTGDWLDSRQRWTDAKKAISDVLAARPSGAGAYDQYSEVIALVLRLSREIVDDSRLILDPELGTFHLMDVAVVRLPEIIVAAGRAADLAALASPGATRSDPTQLQALVARYTVATETDAVGTGIAKALDASESRTVGTNITGQLDAFRSAVDAFVPSGTRLRGLDVVDPATLARAGTTVRQAALPLAEAILMELDSALESRVGTLVWQRILLAAGAGLTLFLLIVLIWLLLSRVRAVPDRTGQARRDPRGHEAGGGELRTTDARASQVDPRSRPDGRRSDPLDLLAVEGTRPGGRLARAARRERGGDAG